MPVAAALTSLGVAEFFCGGDHCRCAASVEPGALLEGVQVMHLTSLTVFTPLQDSREGRSGQANTFGFRPAFKDVETGKVHLSCHGDGTAASVHVLDGLPNDWVRERDPAGHVVEVKCSVVAGFVRDSHFYTREQVAQLIALLREPCASEP